MTALLKTQESEDIVMKNIRSEMMIVTPEIAKRFLDNNKGNRSVSKKTVARYGSSIKQGKWDANGESIKIAHDGTLLDGQHRLLAVIGADTPVPMMVTRGLPRSSFLTIDTGKMRTGGDVIGMGDESLVRDQDQICAACRVLMQFDANGFWSHKRTNRIANHEIMDVYEANKGIVRSVRFAKSLTQARKICPVSVMAALHYKFTRIDLNRGEFFFAALNTGAELKAEHPVFVLRRRLFDMQQRSGRLDGEKIMPYVIKAWHHFVNGEEISVLKMPEDYIPVVAE